MAGSSPKIEGNTLGARLRERIRRKGPISFHDWMDAALYDPAVGYYCRQDRVRWGREGDYRTAPETSPLFAATFARYFARIHVELGSPSHWTIKEAGAGSGEFALGVLSSLRTHHPNAFAATRYLIDEFSAAAREQISERLLPFHQQVGFGTVREIEEPVTGIVFSNELLDALPVHRATMRKGSWRELCVGLDGEQFVWIETELTSQLLAEHLERSTVELSEGQIVEVNLAAKDWIVHAAASLARGVIISVDYGSERDDLFGAPHRHSGSLRAIHRHQIVSNPLANPGDHDLTTTVDWTLVKEAGKQAGLKTMRFERLDQFLLNEGLLEELETLARAEESPEASRLRTSAREMIMPHGMASAFQVLIQGKP